MCSVDWAFVDNAQTEVDVNSSKTSQQCCVQYEKIYICASTDYRYAIEKGTDITLVNRYDTENAEL